ncbi:MAG TPA: CRISPR-associated endonuclease Cas1 [Allosphingosinicella sp.]|jgi:CRISPR-associated endonuclease Cas1|nr:CRISPR-associated endonuclease Cas1 [Allosphingosinicella sp.]
MLLDPQFAHAEIEAQPQCSALDASAPDEWTERSDFWLEDTARQAKPRRKRERNPNPLILCGHGVSLRVEHGALVIRDGFTHYPQEQARFRFFPRDLELPTRILLLDGSGTLSFDVLSWLAEQGVALARVSWTGEVATVASGTGYAPDREKLRWQHETRADETKRLAFAADIIRQKLAITIATLEHYVPASGAREVAIAKASAGIDRLGRERFSDMNGVFAIEGECASAYFAAWHGLPLSWKGVARRPVPDDWHRYSGRSSLATGVKAENRNASHPLNAMLNYGYAVKLAEMKIQAIADGYDPSFGIMHNGKRGNPAFVLDLIEPERPRVDAATLAFVQSRTFAAADFVVSPNGSCRLSPQLARAVAALAA